MITFLMLAENKKILTTYSGTCWENTSRGLQLFPSVLLGAKYEILHLRTLSNTSKYPCFLGGRSTHYFSTTVIHCLPKSILKIRKGLLQVIMAETGNLSWWRRQIGLLVPQQWNMWIQILHIVMGAQKRTWNKNNLTNWTTTTSTNFRQPTHMVSNTQNVSLWKDNPNLKHSSLIVAERTMIFKGTHIL